MRQLTENPPGMDYDPNIEIIHNGRVTFEDSGHVSVEGALLMKPVFEPVFAP